MPRFSELDQWFICPYRHTGPYREGWSHQALWERLQSQQGAECHYEYQLAEVYKELDEQRRQRQQVELENQQLQAQLHALHSRQFKGRRIAPAPPSECASPQRKKRGAPFGHPPWQRAQPTRIDQVVSVPAPTTCPHCGNAPLQPVAQVHQHLQEDIVLQPRTVVTAFRHQQAHCPRCHKNLWRPGPGEMPGAYIGPAAKATAAYLRYQLNVPDRKISQFFSDFFGLQFVPASAFGFERHATRPRLSLYEDLRQKVRALPVVHADETSWRHDGQAYWLWYAGDDDLAFYHLDAHRSAQAAQSVLGQRFAGNIVGDASASY